MNEDRLKERKQCEKDRDILKIVEAAPSLKYRRWNKYKEKERIVKEGKK